MSHDILKARQEVHKTLSMCDFSTRKIAISFIADLPTTLTGHVMMKSWFVFSVSALVGLIVGEMTLLTSLLISSSSVVAFVASLHIVGYGTMSLTKCLTLWFKRDVFRQVVNDLVELWPVSPLHEDAADLKRRSLTALRYFHLCYFIQSLVGVSFYNITPIALYLYRRSRGVPADIGYVWTVLYPIDKTKPFFHEFVYIFECFAGLVSVWSQLGGDLIFTAMASHISMLLRLLQVRIRNLGDRSAVSLNTETKGKEKRGGSKYNDNTGNIDCYEEIVEIIKVHQRLISYSKDLEDVFAMVNLINVLLSSVNICCVVFNIVLIESWLDISNKFFLVGVLTQVGIICWHADEIYRAANWRAQCKMLFSQGMLLPVPWNYPLVDSYDTRGRRWGKFGIRRSIGVANAVYESGWYKTNPRCRRALLLLLQRSQKPLYFTALKFRNITMTTYTSILTTSYSYFTLLYTIYNG